MNDHHIALNLNMSTVWGLIWGPVGVRLGILAVLEPSWSRLGAILGRPDAVVDVLECCLVFGRHRRRFAISGPPWPKRQNVGPPGIDNACARARIREINEGSPPRSGLTAF